ncbi:MAG TPA: VanZ family protein [Pirellulales bacterium]|nr:VanZ family protein [Pirellulales bacterium]
MIAIDKDDAQEPSRPATRKRARRWLTGFWLLLVALTHFPNPYPHRSEPQHFDKVVHFSLYAALAVLALRSLTLAARWASPIARCTGIFAAVVAFGLFDEATQPITGRDFDWFDWLADGLGALAGVACYEMFRRRVGRAKRVPP